MATLNSKYFTNEALLNNVLTHKTYQKERFTALDNKGGYIFLSLLC